MTPPAFAANVGTFVAKHWKLIGWGVTALGFAIALWWQSEATDKQRARADKAEGQIAAMEAAAAKQEADAARRVAEATDRYVERTTIVQPIIEQSKASVRDYAQTDAGRTGCLDADRVRGIKDLDRALEAAPAAESSADAVRNPAPE